MQMKNVNIYLLYENQEESWKDGSDYKNLKIYSAESTTAVFYIYRLMIKY